MPKSMTVWKPVYFVYPDNETYRYCTINRNKASLVAIGYGLREWWYALKDRSLRNYPRRVWIETQTYKDGETPCSE